MLQPIWSVGGAVALQSFVHALSLCASFGILISSIFRTIVGPTFAMPVFRFFCRSFACYTIINKSPSLAATVDSCIYEASRKCRTLPGKFTILQWANGFVLWQRRQRKHCRREHYFFATLGENNRHVRETRQPHPRDSVSCCRRHYLREVSWFEDKVDTSGRSKVDPVACLEKYIFSTLRAPQSIATYHLCCLFPIGIPRMPS